MEKKRFQNQNLERETISDVVRICEESNVVFFEIGNDITNDPAEAVALMMRYPRNDYSFWKKSIQFDIDNIEPKKCLYWLTGGDSEWITLQNYKSPWNQCYLEFQEEFGYMVMEIIKNSKSLGDIRQGFSEKLNLTTIYDFALSKNLIR
jgi:hypothetical protein